MRRWAAVAVAAPVLAGAVLLACGDADEAASGSPYADGGAYDAKSDGNFQAEDAAVGPTSGVVLLHAASFPPFRLCFENFPELPPQPEATLMPESNQVGVEIGSLARIGALTRAPGKVWVFDQRKVAATPSDAPKRSCGELLADDALVADLAYHLAGNVSTPLGTGGVDVLAITGCGGKVLLASAGMSEEGCTDWDETSGSLRAWVVPLLPTVNATPRSLPVQVVHMAPRLEALRAASGTSLELAFGPLADDASAPQRIEVPPLFQAGGESQLHVDLGTEAFFGTYGFSVALRGTDAGAPAAPVLEVNESLATAQELSAPHALPTSYYLTASNYALLLVGDPQVQRTLADGGPNPTYDVRRAVHLLAAPVKADDRDGDGGIAQR